MPNCRQCGRVLILRTRGKRIFKRDWCDSRCYRDAHPSVISVPFRNTTPLSRIAKRLERFHGVLSIDQDALGDFYVNVTDFGVFVERDARGRQAPGAGRIFKMRRFDVSTVSNLEAAFAVEMQKAR